MATARCEVVGGTVDTRAVVCAAIERALQHLDWATSLRATIEERPHELPDHEAAADVDGIWVRPDLARKGEPRLGWVLTEEVAHCYLYDHAGVPHGGTFIETLVQELFGAWAQYREHVLTGRIPRAFLTTTPVMEVPQTTPQDLPVRLGYQLGKHIAAAALGSAQNACHLRTWLAKPEPAPGLHELVRGLSQQLPWRASPLAMAEPLKEFYIALGGQPPSASS